RPRCQGELATDFRVAPTGGRGVELEDPGQQYGTKRSPAGGPLVATAEKRVAHGANGSQSLLLRERAGEGRGHHFSTRIEIPSPHDSPFQVQESTPQAVSGDGIGRRIEGGGNEGLDAMRQGFHAGTGRGATIHIQRQCRIADHDPREEVGAAESAAASLRQGEYRRVGGFRTGPGGCGYRDRRRQDISDASAIPATA